MDVPLSVLEHVQTDHSHTECPPLEPLNLTVINTTRIKIRHYRQVYTDRSDPIVFLPVSDYTSSPVYDDFVLLIFFHVHREASILAGESSLAVKSEQFRFLWTARLSNIKDSAGLILSKVSVMRVTIPIDLSTRPFIPLPRFFNSRRVPPLIDPSFDLFPLQLAWAAHDVRSCAFKMNVHFESFIGLLCIIVLAWHYFLVSRLFLFCCNK